MTYGDGWQTPGSTPDPQNAGQPTPGYTDPTIPLPTQPPYGYPNQPVPPTYPAQPQYSAPPAYPSQPQYSAPPAYPTDPQYQTQPQYSAPPVYQAQPQYSAPPAYSAPPSFGAPGGYPYGTPTPPPQRNTGLIVAIVVVVVLLIGGGITAGVVLLKKKDNPSANPSAGTSATTPTAGPTSATPSSTDFDGDLRTLLLTPPSTSSPFQNPVSTDGKLTKQQVADSFDDPAGIIPILDQYGFKGGAIVQWHDADQTEVTIKLYQFDSATNAQRWLFFNEDGYASDTSKTNQSPVDGIPDSGMYVAKKGDDKGFFLTDGVASKGGIYMIAFIWQPNRQNKAVVTDILQRQFARLP